MIMSGNAPISSLISSPRRGVSTWARIRIRPPITTRSKANLSSNPGRYLRQFSTSHVSLSSSSLDFTHVVIGAGVVGLSIATRLAEREGGNTILLERRGAFGTETSSRGSEVIHAGFYYPKDSLKTKLCIAGRRKLYEFCEKHSVGHNKTTKWVLAQTDEEAENLEKLAKHAASLEDPVPTRFLSPEEAKKEEPDVVGRALILESPETGIVDSHGMMLALLGELENAGGVLAIHSSVSGIERLPDGAGFRLSINQDEGEAETATITASTVTISAGLDAIRLSNLLRPYNPNVKPRTPRYAKGNYYAYQGPKLRVKRLLYPAPSSDPGFAGLGTHLTLDLGGQIRFGPDVEWLSEEQSKQTSAHKDVFGPKSDLYTPSPARIHDAVAAVKRYLPSVKDEDLRPDYAGIRPKMVGPGSGFEDFWIKRIEGDAVGVECLGIESPGLTSSLAIGEYVEALIYGGKT